MEGGREGGREETGECFTLRLKYRVVLVITPLSDSRVNHQFYQKSEHRKMERIEPILLLVSPRRSEILTKTLS